MDEEEPPEPPDEDEPPDEEEPPELPDEEEPPELPDEEEPPEPPDEEEPESLFVGGLAAPSDGVLPEPFFSASIAFLRDSEG